MGVQLSLQSGDFICFEHIPQRQNTASHGSSIFDLLMNLQNVFHNGCSNLHTNDILGFSFFPHSC